MPNQLCHSRNISSQECPSFPANVNCWHIALSKVDKCQTASFLFGLCVAAWPNWPISVKTNNRQRPIAECMINKGSRIEIGRQYWNDWFSFHHFLARTLHVICDWQLTKDRNKTANWQFQCSFHHLLAREGKVAQPVKLGGWNLVRKAAAPISVNVYHWVWFELRTKKFSSLCCPKMYLFAENILKLLSSTRAAELVKSCNPGLENME